MTVFTAWPGEPPRQGPGHGRGRVDYQACPGQPGRFCRSTPAPELPKAGHSHVRGWQHTDKSGGDKNWAGPLMPSPAYTRRLPPGSTGFYRHELSGFGKRFRDCESLGEIAPLVRCTFPDTGISSKQARHWRQALPKAGTGKSAGYEAWTASERQPPPPGKTTGQATHCNSARENASLPPNLSSAARQK